MLNKQAVKERANPQGMIGKIIKSCHFNMTLFTTIVILFLTPIEAHANAGSPMLAVAWPVLWLTFISIVLIEWWTIKSYFPKIPARFILGTTSLSNFLSTFAGIPITWIALVFLEMILLFLLEHSSLNSLTWSNGSPARSIQSIGFILITFPWIMPYENQFFWVISAAFTLLMAPFFSRYLTKLKLGG